LTAVKYFYGKTKDFKITVIEVSVEAVKKEKSGEVPLLHLRAEEAS